MVKWSLIFILLLLSIVPISYAAVNITSLNITVSDKNSVKLVPICGDSKKDLTENCANCPKDSPCEKGFNCVSSGKCQKKSALLLVTAIIFVIMAILTASYFSYEFLLKGRIKNLFAKKEGQPLQKEAELIKQAVQSIPPQQAQVQEVEPKKPEANLAQEQKPETKSEVQPKPSKQAGKKEETLKGYIMKMLDKGHPINEIAGNLLKAGWPKDKVDETLKSVKLNKQAKKP